MLKIDLHTHSVASKDGGISVEQYKTCLKDKLLDYIAITDHDTIALAQQLNHDLGKQIIVGEEISTPEGDIIGLFLHKKVPANLPILKAIEHIKDQNGLVYIPHPLESVRSAVSQSTLEVIAQDVDIVEVFNGRALIQNKAPKAAMWTRINSKAEAASSDAHGISGLGKTYTIVNEAPTRSNLVQQLQTAKKTIQNPSFKDILYPTINRFRKRLNIK